MTLLPVFTPPVARIVNRLSLARPEIDEPQFHAARATIPGWSQPFHFTFFGHVLAELPHAARMLVCGVYHGLDLALIQHAARLLGKKIHLAGVDRFSAEPCADWPEEKQGLTWEQAFNCPPPSLDAARRNAPDAEIIQADSIEYLDAHAPEFDFIYLDTSHDEHTVSAEISAIELSLLLHLQRDSFARRPLLLAGDDYHQPGSCWGVDRAVTNILPHHVVLFNRIWLSQL